MTVAELIGKLQLLPDGIPAQFVTDVGDDEVSAQELVAWAGRVRDWDSQAPRIVVLLPQGVRRPVDMDAEFAKLRAAIEQGG